MDARFRYDLIKVYIRALVPALGGVRKPVEPATLRRLFDAKDYAGMLAEIQQTMHLGCKVQLNIEEEIPCMLPETTIAWSEIPRWSLPNQNSPSFADTHIIIGIKKKFLFNLPLPFECIVEVMAHELAHVVLYAMNHPLKKHEEATDLAAMILGYADFFVDSASQPVVLRSSTKNRLLDLFRKVTRKTAPQYIVELGHLTQKEKIFATVFLRTDKEI